MILAVALGCIFEPAGAGPSASTVAASSHRASASMVLADGRKRMITRAWSDADDLEPVGVSGQAATLGGPGDLLTGCALAPG
jgi:hypothetical protein